METERCEVVVLFEELLGLLYFMQHGPGWGAWSAENLLCVM